MLISEWMGPELANEAAMTRKLLEKIPHDKLSWKPAEGMHTIGWNASHLVEIAAWVPDVMRSGEFDVAPPGAPPYVTPEVTDLNQLLKTFDGHVAAALQALQGVPDSVLDEPWSLKMGGQTLFTIKKRDCLHKWVISHTAHHRGILSAYLRMAGVSFPSIYEE